MKPLSELNEKRLRKIKVLMFDLDGTFISNDSLKSSTYRYLEKLRDNKIKTVVVTGRPAGWHFMKEYVDKDGNVFHKGKEQLKLKGTLPPTKVKPPKKRKKLTADEKLFKKAADYKKRLKARRGK